MGGGEDAGGSLDQAGHSAAPHGLYTGWHGGNGGDLCCLLLNVVGSSGIWVSYPAPSFGACDQYCP